MTEAGTSPDAPIDSPTDWVKAHIDEYVATGGEQGHVWRGVPTLLLTYQGAKTGTWRRTALIYGTDGDAYVLVASKGGAPAHPAWYEALLTNPSARLQVGPDVFDVRARTAGEEERARLWPAMAAIWPQYDDYQQATDREIPVVVLERA
jgi:deazaflavin-dependent oxidoreductase (nitroreductase family)